MKIFNWDECLKCKKIKTLICQNGQLPCLISACNPEPKYKQAYLVNENNSKEQTHE